PWRGPLVGGLPVAQALGRTALGRSGTIAPAHPVSLPDIWRTPPCPSRNTPSPAETGSFWPVRPQAAACTPPLHRPVPHGTTLKKQPADRPCTSTPGPAASVPTPTCNGWALRYRRP